MKTLIAVACLLAATCTAAPQDKYTNRYDSVKINDVLRSDRLRQAYVKCLLEQGQCSNDAIALRRTLPEALATDCAKCTDKQKQGAETVVHYFINNKPQEWRALEAKYDPSGGYRKRYEQRLKQLKQRPG